MTTNPYTLLIAMKLDGDYISQESAVLFAKEYARLELQRLGQKIELENTIKGKYFCTCSPNEQNFYNGICKRCKGHR